MSKSKMISVVKAVEEYLKGKVLEYKLSSGSTRQWRALCYVDGNTYTAGLPAPKNFSDPRWNRQDLPMAELLAAEFRYPRRLLVEEKLRTDRRLAEDELVSLHHVDFRELTNVLAEGADYPQQRAVRVLIYLRTKVLGAVASEATDAEAK